MTDEIIEQDDDTEVLIQEDENDIAAPEGGDAEPGFISSFDDADGDAAQDEEVEDIQSVKSAHQQALIEKAKLEQELAQIKAASQPAAQSAPTLPPKPIIEDFDYDADVYSEKLEEWFDAKNKHAQYQSKQQEAQQKDQEQWQAKVQKYVTEKEKMKAPDFLVMEHQVQSQLNSTQQSILVKGAENSAALVYALGRSTSELKKLAEIQDPIQFAFAIAKLENKMKVKPKTSPERIPGKTMGGSSSVSEAKLNRALAEAEKSGDYTNVYKMKHAKKA